MVLRAMGSQGGGGGGTAETAGGGHGKASQLKGLPGQNSLYGLKLDEVQNQLSDLGKPLGSMSLGELLKSIWTAGLRQSAGVDAENAASGNQSNLQHQSSMSLARALSKRTVDDVWKEILQTKSKGEKKPKERQPTLGEMTLDDFLLKAGVFVQSASDKTTTDVVNSSIAAQISQQAQWMQHSLPPHAHPQHTIGTMPVYMPAQTLSQPPPTGAGPMIDHPFGDNHLTLPLPLPLTWTSGRKRSIPYDIVDKSIERKQKRMVKNRESAARSRARKQAYTNELENKVSRLEEENEKLRKHQELEKMRLHVLPPGPKYQLRRTSSAPY